jgi:SulP family sulfate permease
MPDRGLLAPARTATNVRAGAKSHLSGIMHALFLLIFLLVAAPLAAYVPLAALAGVLVVVCWYMVEKKDFAALLRRWPSAVVLLATFGLTVFRDLTTGIIAGCVLAALLAAFHRSVPEEGA